MGNLTNDNSYRLVIYAKMPEGEQAFEADITEEVGIDLSTTITSQPLVNGDIIGDHMFRQPTTVNIPCSFSLHGNQPTDYTGGYERLDSIQKTFERIMNEGIFCRLITLSRASTNKTRFSERKNMVLQNISWGQKQNSLSANFSFREVLTVAVIEEQQVDFNDEDLPDITDGVQADFTDTFLNKDEVTNIIVQTLVDYDLFAKDFGEYFVANITADWLGILGISLATGAAVVAIVGLVVGISSGALAGAATALGVAIAAGPAGWAAAGIAVVAVGLFCFFAELFKANKRAQAEKEFTNAFKLYKNNELKNKQEVDRFLTYLSSIYNNLEVLEDVCQVYTITSDNPQECMLYIDDEYYIFKFTRNNTNDNTFSCQVEDVNGANVGNSITNTSSCITNLGDCTESNVVFITSSGFRVYLINIAETKVAQDNTLKLDEEKKKLTNLVMLVSQVNMEEFTQLLKDLTINAMKRGS